MEQGVQPADIDGVGIRLVNNLLAAARDPAAWTVAGDLLGHRFDLKRPELVFRPVPAAALSFGEERFALSNVRFDDVSVRCRRGFAAPAVGFHLRFRSHLPTVFARIKQRSHPAGVDEVVDVDRLDLDVREVPQVWNDKMAEYLGIRPETDAEGCLQDIHWTNGTFGYFPTYSLGSVLAAQLFEAAEDDLGTLEADIREGEFGDLQEWLTDHVHRHGKRYTTDDLVREATGEPFTAEYFLDYVTEKYETLYDL